jgi:alpha-L-fucosidase 2
MWTSTRKFIDKTTTLGALASLCLAATAWSGPGIEAQAPSGRQIYFNQHAKTWSEALPIGNGSLGAMVYGRVGREILKLNLDTLWQGGAVDRRRPNAKATASTMTSKGLKGNAETVIYGSDEAEEIK